MDSSGCDAALAAAGSATAGLGEEDAAGASGCAAMANAGCAGAAPDTFECGLDCVAWIAGFAGSEARCGFAFDCGDFAAGASVKSTSSRTMERAAELPAALESAYRFTSCEASGASEFGVRAVRKSG